MKNLVELITSNEWNALSKEQRIDELQRQIDEIKNEMEYPVFCYSMGDNPFIVKFDGLKSGEVVKQGIHPFGYRTDLWSPYTNTVKWKPLSYNKERGLYHTQLVWAWNDVDTHCKFLRFYDEINNVSFTFVGKMNGMAFDNYEPYQGEWPQWAIEAHKTLEGLND